MPAESEAEKSSKSRKASGKKRKKKKINGGSATAGARGAKMVRNSMKDHEKSRTERCIRTVSDNDIMMTNEITTDLVLSQTSSPAKVQSCAQFKEDVYSSSSSIENSRPITKLGRFDSSDTLSVGGHTNASSLTAVDVSLPSPNLSIIIPNNSSQCHSKTLHGNLVARENPSSDAETKVLDSSSSTAGEGALQDKIPLVIESLRWDHECSDEEKEKERIEIYKKNRRKRYENALAEKKAELLLHTSNKANYYFS